MSEITGGFFNAGGNTGPSIEAAGATTVLATVVNIADWQIRRTNDQVEVIQGVIIKTAEFAKEVARNLWDELNSYRVPLEPDIRPINAPPPTPTSKYLKARPGGSYSISYVSADGTRADGGSLGNSLNSYAIISGWNNYQSQYNNKSGSFPAAYYTDYQTGVNTKFTPTQVSVSGVPIDMGGTEENPDNYVIRTFFTPTGGVAVEVNDLDPFIGPVPGTRTPVRRRPIVTPIPTVQPATVPFPNPQRQPDREVAPPSPDPQPQPEPQRLPDQTPGPGRTTPQPATTPTTTPAPFIPVVVPQVTPNRTTQTNPDGSRQTAALPGAITTPAGNEKIGPVTVTTNAPQPTLAGIAGEVGRIEQKLAKMIRPPGDGDLTDRLGLLGSVLKALYEEFFTGLPAGGYILSSSCEKDEQGDRIEYEVPILQTQNRFDAIYERLDALADLIQTHKDLKQPICRGTQPTGQPVTVNFTQIE